DAATLAARLAEATANGALPAARLGPFIADVEAARSQAPFGRTALAATPLAAALDALLLPGDATRPWRALVNLQPGDGKPLDVDRVRAAIADVPNVRVVAIGSNYALFFDHLKERGEADADTLASLLLANLTTVASFALLASSAIPVLRAVGIVVAPGALLCLVFSASWLGRGDGRAARVHGKIAP